MSSPLPPEGQARPPQSEGFCLAPHSTGLGWPLARRPQELVLPRPPAAGKRQEAPTLCLRPVRAARNLPQDLVRILWEGPGRRVGNSLMELVRNLRPRPQTAPTSVITLLGARPLAPIIPPQVPAAASHQRHPPTSSSHSFVGLSPAFSTVSKALLLSPVSPPPRSPTDCCGLKLGPSKLYNPQCATHSDPESALEITL
ncbi:hypothetical protein J1605_023061 [Eschrichtius robustus]|uniref:Uncharacterized protein n=1 Tax=Eschrichtius robustus TaxID=9764 RepID=A0AB34H8N4_ESCRO|nr:hypothetical protein J1605_023061 [Eschrichtius robustus]